jgi:hypothetical protein
MTGWSMRHGVWTMSLVTCVALVPARAAGYSSPSLYAADPVAAGGGGGRAFTGSPVDGLDCGVCHRGGPAPTLTLRGGPGGAYMPGATYQFEMEWPSELHLGVTAEAADPSGEPLGQLRVPTGDDLLVTERCAGGGPAARLLALEGRAPVALGDCGATRLRFQWTAPDSPIEGDLYVAIVLADGEGSPEGDGVATFTVPLTTGAAVGSGCAIGRAPTFGWLGLLFLLRRRRRVIGIVGLGLGLLSGCARVLPHERGRLAQPDMKPAPDPDLTAGTEHALEYREGSAGGLGGGGGGCGCN